MRFLLIPALFCVELVAAQVPPTFRQYCVQCHGKAAMGGVNLEKMSSQSIADSFEHWLKVANALEQRVMPPPKMPQPSDAQRAEAVQWIRTSIRDYARRHANDPGQVTLRRLTSGEYGYTVEDLTGVDLRLDQDFASDAVGGEGFTNFGDVQYMADANLERYLQTAKQIARHAVIGAGPIEFYDDAGKSGFEYSAVARIQQIYDRYGFRAGSGEGGKPYGLDRYRKAFYVAWRHRHRVALGESKATLASLAVRHGITPQFAEHIWQVVNQPAPSYPTVEVVRMWRNLPAPNGNSAAVEKQCYEIEKQVIGWPRWLFAAGEAAEGGRGDERALVITEASIQPVLKHKFTFNLRRKRGENRSSIHLVAAAANPNASVQTRLIWRNPQVKIRRADRSSTTAEPLRTIATPETAAKAGFGSGGLGPNDFATAGDAHLIFDVPTPGGAAGLVLEVEVEMDPSQAGGAVYRCTLSDSDKPSEGTPVWALLANAADPEFQKWRKGVMEYAANLPQASQGEVTPSDKDEIPAPFNNTYNQPERDHYHVKLKYYRQDSFLRNKILDAAMRQRLDDAWADLYAAFAYHEEFLRFLDGKYHLNLKGKALAKLTAAEIQAMPAEPRKYVAALRAEYDAVQKAQLAARPRHIEDCLRFAERAWRRPLSAQEKDQLRGYYQKLRRDLEMEHVPAVRALLARILVAPAFLYRLEQPNDKAAPAPLSNWEMASRLSYFLWSSLPDDELRRAAAAGELQSPQHLRAQVKRMLADPKAGRMATEFFGQWLGFYRFDQYRGVDSTRFPEFTDEVKAGMYAEATAFFTHILRQDRPVRELIFADYTFLTPALAKHYGISKEVPATGVPVLVEGSSQFQRGGLLRLGAVLTTTSAPLRTSPVKRGDWLLRRVLGTPIPPPPADAGSIPADDKLFGGMTVKQRLESHRRNATCAGCHTRIDPLGFALEHYDPVGRWRSQYSDGKPIDASGTLSDHTEITGVAGLMDYMKRQQYQVQRTLAYKLLGYALGRTVLASDQLLVEELAEAGGDTKFSELVSKIVVSPQFRYLRGRETMLVGEKR